MRVPKDAKVAVNVAVLSPEHFDKWDSFHNLLLVKTVPMVQMLPRKERQKILQNLSIKDFRDVVSSARRIGDNLVVTHQDVDGKGQVQRYDITSGLSLGDMGPTFTFSFPHVEMTSDSNTGNISCRCPWTCPLSA